MNINVSCCTVDYKAVLPIYTLRLFSQNSIWHLLVISHNMNIIIGLLVSVSILKLVHYILPRPVLVSVWRQHWCTLRWLWYPTILSVKFVSFFFFFYLRFDFYIKITIAFVTYALDFFFQNLISINFLSLLRWYIHTNLLPFKSLTDRAATLEFRTEPQITTWPAIKQITNTT